MVSIRRKCFISFKGEDLWYKTTIQNQLDVNMIDKSLNEAIDSTDDDYILSMIRGGLFVRLDRYDSPHRRGERRGSWSTRTAVHQARASGISLQRQWQHPKRDPWRCAAERPRSRLPRHAHVFYLRTNDHARGDQ